MKKLQKKFSFLSHNHRRRTRATEREWRTGATPWVLGFSKKKKEKEEKEKEKGKRRGRSAPADTVGQEDSGGVEEG